jgi:formate transporter
MLAVPMVLGIFMVIPVVIGLTIGGAYILRDRRALKAVQTRLSGKSVTEKSVRTVPERQTVDDYTPVQVARRVETAGINKGTQNILTTVLLGMLAGVFIGMGAMLYTLVTTDTGLGFGLTRLLGGISFCLGLVLVVVAGAELFTGNSLVVMSWMSGQTSFKQLLRNWSTVYFANLVGALSLAVLIFYSHQWTFNNYGVGANALLIANSKVNLSFTVALTRGILCNVLVCLAVWLSFGARTITGKIMAIIFPITAFVVAGFEHSIANMYFIPMGILMANQPAVLEASGLTVDSISNLTWTGFIGNLIPVTIGNIIGGGILIAAVYWIAYLRREKVAIYQSQPRLAVIIPVNSWKKAMTSAITRLKSLVPPCSRVAAKPVNNKMAEVTLSLKPQLPENR